MPVFGLKDRVPQPQGGTTFTVFSPKKIGVCRCKYVIPRKIRPRWTMCRKLSSRVRFTTLMKWKMFSWWVLQSVDYRNYTPSNGMHFGLPLFVTTSLTQCCSVVVTREKKTCIPLSSHHTCARLALKSLKLFLLRKCLLSCQKTKLSIFHNYDHVPGTCRRLNWFFWLEMIVL